MPHAVYLLLCWTVAIAANHKRQTQRFTIERNGRYWMVVDWQTKQRTFALDQEDASFIAIECRMGLTQDYAWHS